MTCPLSCLDDIKHPAANQKWLDNAVSVVNPSLDFHVIISIRLTGIALSVLIVRSFARVSYLKPVRAPANSSCWLRTRQVVVSDWSNQLTLSPTSHQLWNLPLGLGIVCNYGSTWYGIKQEVPQLDLRHEKPRFFPYCFRISDCCCVKEISTLIS